MANDRIWLECKHCGCKTLFAKYYPTLETDIWFQGKLGDFINRHVKCSPEFGNDNLKGDRCFNLMTESGLNPIEVITIRNGERNG